MAKEMKLIDKEIAAIGVAGKKLDDRIQACAVDVLEHFAEFKDTGLVNRLYIALSKGARKSAMASWLMAYAAVVANDHPGTKLTQPFVYSKTKTTDPVKAAADPWYDHKPDAAPDEIFDLQKAVKMVLAKAGKASTLKGGDQATLVALAGLVGIPASDVPSRPEAADAPAEVMAEDEQDPLA